MFARSPKVDMIITDFFSGEYDNKEIAVRNDVSRGYVSNVMRRYFEKERRIAQSKADEAEKQREAEKVQKRIERLEKTDPDRAERLKRAIEKRRIMLEKQEKLRAYNRQKDTRRRIKNRAEKYAKMTPEEKRRLECYDQVEPGEVNKKLRDMAPRGPYKKFDEKIDEIRAIKEGRHRTSAEKDLGDAATASIGAIVAQTYQNRMVSRQINTLDQLAAVNDSSIFLLDQIRLIMEGGEKAKEAAKNWERITPKNGRHPDPREILIKIIAEIRNQLTLQVNIYETLYEAKEVEAFQTDVLDVMSEMAPELRYKLIEKLKERRSARRLFVPDGGV